LIVGIAVSVSAVPVILRILQELNLLGTAVGRRVVLIAVLCDIGAWLLFIPILPATDLATWLKSHYALLMFLIGTAIALFLPKVSRTREWVKTINFWLVGPVFFIGIGQRLDLSHGVNWMQLSAILAVAVIAKFLGVWLFTRGTGLPIRERQTMALALNCRGAMEVVLASFALEAGVIAPDLFTSLIAMAIATTLIVKPVVKLLEKPRALG
jgi:Kef-type K+ transport system membrane component KefB